MKKLATTFFFILIFVFTIQQAHAMTVRAEASPLLQPGIIGIGKPFTIDIYMNNNDSIHANPINGSRLSISMSLNFFCPDGSIQNVTHLNFGDYGPTGNISFLNDFETFWYLYFEVIGWDYNGILPDSMNITAIANQNGWPYNLGEQLYIQFNFKVDDTGTFCIDSIGGRTPTYDWLFDSPSPNFNGPYCWTVGYGPYRTNLLPDPMYAPDAYTHDSVFAGVNIYVLDQSHTITDVETSTVRINDNTVPVSFDYLPADSIAEALRANILTREFLPSYLPAWDTSMQYYSVTGEFTDGSVFSTYNWFELIGHRSGDANGDGNIDIFDVSYLISYLYLGGLSPNPDVIGDTNGDCTINLFDITYLINYLYNEGSPPLHGCQ